MRAWWIVVVFTLLVACTPRIEDPTGASSVLDRTPPTVRIEATSTAEGGGEEPFNEEDDPIGECEWWANGVAWVDANANGRRESEELPLENVQFYVDDTANNLTRVSRPAVTDVEGETTFGISFAGCPTTNLVVYTEAPAGYRATTEERREVAEKSQLTETFAFGFVYEGAAPPTPRPARSLTCTTFNLQFENFSSNPTDIAVAPDGSVWVSTNGGRVAWIAPGADEPILFTMADGIPDEIGRAIEVAPDGTVWLATNSALAFYDGNSWQTAAELGRDLTVQDLAITGSGEIWMGNVWGHPARFDPATGTLDTYPYHGPFAGTSYTVEGMESSPSGSLWYFAPDAVYQLTAPPEPRWIVHKEGLRQLWGDLEILEAEAATVVSDDELWLLGGMQYGWPLTIVKMNPTTGEWITYSHSATGGAMPGGTIADFALAPDGTLWVALQDGGALHFLPDADDPTRGTWLTYTTANGLGGEFINLIAVTPDGALWLGYDAGIVERCVETP